MSTRSRLATVTLATAATLLFGSLMWVYERKSLWMLAVILPPIWIPSIRQFSTPDHAPERSRAMIWLFVAGLAALCVLAVVVYVS